MSRKINFDNVRSLYSLKLPEGLQKHRYPDPTCPGLNLYASRAGARKWKFRFNLGTQRNLEIDIGEIAHISYAAARQKAASFYSEVKAGRDPRSLATPTAVVTLRSVVEHYVSGLATSSQKNLQSKLQPVLDRFGDVPATEVRRQAVKQFISAQWPGKTTTARLVARNLTAAFNRALDEDHGLDLPVGTSNPFDRFSRVFDFPDGWVAKSRKVAFEQEEYRLIFKALDEGYRDPEVRTLGVLCLELILLSGARPSEIESLRWDEVQTVAGVPDAAVITKRRHKTWKKVREPRRIRLAGQGVALLARARAEAERLKYDGPWVFPAKRVQKNNASAPHFTSSWSLARKLSSRVGFQFRPGSFRSAYINHALSTAETSGADFSETLKRVAANVGHRDPQVTINHYMASRPSSADEIARQTEDGLAGLRRAA